MVFLKKRWLYFLLPLLALFAVFAVLQRPAPVQYITSPVRYGNIEQTVLASGTLNAVNQVNVGSQVSGQLKSLKVALGDQVTKDQLIAEIDPILQQYTLRQAQASLDSAKAQKQAKQALLRQYELAYRRQQQMWQQDATSRASLEEAAATLDTTRAAINQLDAEITSAQVSVDTAKANLGYTRITAPISGTVVAIVTKEGQTVAASQSVPTIIKLANLDTMTVKAEISEADVIHVKPGMSVWFTTLGDPDKRYHATLRAIEPASTSSSDDDNSSSSSSSSDSSSSSSSAVYYNGLFDIANPDHKLRVSMTAQVTIVSGEAKNVLLVPIAAVENNAQQQSTVRVLEQGKVISKIIQTGLKDSLNIQIISGLKENEQVILGDSQSSTDNAGNSGQMMPPPGP
ncbi:efflux RND transporter periplasmic adaptor subunit [Tolumonas auensis]|uniref:efflux RND transporter periplasmic adaptor subunit n=1 Tax=Tolumonas auensis TaxID=43948 RepID=UPI002AA6A3D5|nr:efflux RND transporter periplasmic adaptor subunit [Tolumonas auensis]